MSRFASYDPKVISLLLSYDPKVISLFEIIGAYFCDTIFNHIYHSAKNSLGRSSSLSDEYMRCINAYVLGLNNDAKCYSNVVQSVHSYFINMTRFNEISYADFVDRVVEVCVPEEYFQDLSLQDKDELFARIIHDLVSNLASFANTPDMMRRIVDFHNKNSDMTIRMLQDAAVESLITIRASLRNKFMRDVGQVQDMVPLDIVEDIKKALRRLAKEKASALAAQSAAEDKLKKYIRESKQREAKMLKMIELLRHKNNVIKIKDNNTDDEDDDNNGADDVITIHEKQFIPSEKTKPLINADFFKNDNLLKSDDKTFTQAFTPQPTQSVLLSNIINMVDEE